MQEPGMAILVNPALATGETDVEFTFEVESGSESEAPVLALRKLDEEDITPDDRATVTYDIDSEKFWDMLVHTRSRDWTGFCAASREGASDVETKEEPTQTHDEL